MPAIVDHAIIAWLGKIKGSDQVTHSEFIQNNGERPLSAFSVQRIKLGRLPRA